MNPATDSPTDPAVTNMASLLLNVMAVLRDCQAELSASRAERQTPLAVTTTNRESFSTAEVAKMLGKSEYVVRNWARLGRVNATKREERRGGAALWSISADELVRYQNEGLLLIDPSRNDVD